MFTGIVQNVARVSDVRAGGASSRIVLELGEEAREVSVGDSVMVDGCCLTATNLEGENVAFDVSSETLRLTTLGELKAGSGVNFELAMRPTDRFGGHFVSGHVDGVGRILKKERRPGETRLRIRTEPALTDLMILKGSVAVDGISLTVAALERGRFEVSLIPHTLQATTLTEKDTGSPVNVECDMMGKWIRRLVGGEGTDEGLTMDRLREEGF